MSKTVHPKHSLRRYKKYFLGAWGRRAGAGDAVGDGRKLVNIREQMFRMTLCLFKENTCAKLF